MFKKWSPTKRHLGDLPNPLATAQMKPRHRHGRGACMDDHILCSTMYFGRDGPSCCRRDIGPSGLCPSRPSFCSMHPSAAQPEAPPFWQANHGRPLQAGPNADECRESQLHLVGEIEARTGSDLKSSPPPSPTWGWQAGQARYIHTACLCRREGGSPMTGKLARHY